MQVVKWGVYRRMQSDGIARFGQLAKTIFQEIHWYWSLEGSSTLGRLGLKDLFDIRVLQLIH